MISDFPLVLFCFVFFSGNKEQLLLKSCSKTCPYFQRCVALLIKHLFLLLLMSSRNCLQTQFHQKAPHKSPPFHRVGVGKKKTPNLIFRGGKEIQKTPPKSWSKMQKVELKIPISAGFLVGFSGGFCAGFVFKPLFFFLGGVFCPPPKKKNPQGLERGSGLGFSLRQLLSALYKSSGLLRLALCLEK